MASVIGLKLDNWDLSKGKIESVDYWPLMSTPGPVLIILATYLLFVLRVGPAYMQKRLPFQLSGILMGYNGIQVALSAFLAVKYLLHLYRHGLVHTKCLMNEPETEKEVANCIWWYFVAKVTELLDTVFFVLRKKDSQVTFLHLYHHSIMMIGTWTYLKYGPTDNVVFLGFLNSTVHVFMYSYYGLAVLGPRFEKYLRWKKYITKIQLVQFGLAFMQICSTVWVSECPPSKGIYCFFSFNLALFTYLFWSFYRKSYKNKKISTEISATAKSEENISKKQ